MNGVAHDWGAEGEDAGKGAPVDADEHEQSGTGIEPPGEACVGIPLMRRYFQLQKEILRLRHPQTKASLKALN